MYVYIGLFSEGNGASSIRAGRVHSLQHKFILVVAVIVEARCVVFICVCVLACVISTSDLVLLQVNPVIVTSTLNSIALYVYRHTCEMTRTPMSYNELSVEGSSLSQDVTTTRSFSTQCIQFVQPFVLQLDTLYSESRGVAARLCRSVQHSCLATLLQALKLCCASQTKAAMELIVQCRYGFLPMIEWIPSVEYGRQQSLDKKGLLTAYSVANTLYV